MKLQGFELTEVSKAYSIGAGVSSDGLIYELYTAAAGSKGLIDTVNTTAVYDSDEDSYGEGVIQTNQLFETDTAITSLIVEDLSRGNAPHRASLDVSFDNGSTWATGKSLGSRIQNFTGTSSDGGTYKLKLKLTLGTTYDSYTWVTTGSLNQARCDLAGCGTVSAALVFGGYYTDILSTTEKWSGSSWATSGSLNTARMAFGGCGTSSSALSVGGYSTTYLSTTEVWSGSAWATSVGLNQARHSLRVVGTTSAALSLGGWTESAVSTTEKWNGSSWTNTTSLLVIKRSMGVAGTSTNALCFGGDTHLSAHLNSTDIWDGSVWATTGALNAVKSEMAGCGTTSNALCFGGADAADYIDITEMWGGSSWATTTSLNEAKYYVQGCGIYSSALCYGGDSGAVVDTTEKWSGVGNQLGFMAKINPDA